MMRIRFLAILALLAAAAPACKSHHKPMSVDADAGDIPREVALQKLREKLPTAEYTYCTLPKESLKPTEIRAWNVKSDSVEIDLGKSRPISFNFVDITQVKLELSGKYFTVRVYTTVQPDPGKDHFSFLWKQEDPAKSVTELLLSLKKK